MKSFYREFHDLSHYTHKTTSLKRYQTQNSAGGNMSLIVVGFLLGNFPSSEFQTPGNCQEESTQHSEHGESLKSRI
jgi:hypothetical protein